MPVHQLNSLSHLRDLLVLHDRGILARAASVTGCQLKSLRYWYCGLGTMTLVL
jgi:hypothetical protein